ncbi:MAG: RecQ family ATP-dependent DNA helicase, partial [Desulfobulbaceae bacterium]|nr:RecQ family ATP-dependent DNA helicase [Desulfobulbaceae bacterium]
MKDREQFLARCCCVDIEVNEQGAIFHIGALFRDQQLRLEQCTTKTASALAALDRFTEGAEFLVGHNFLDHDLPLLRHTGVELKFLAKPVIDTLYLSPLAFPENPYHRLVKDYKLVHDAINDPVADARLALSLLNDEWEAICQYGQQKPGLINLYRFCLGDQERFFGLTSVFNELGAALPNLEQAEQTAIQLCQDSCCQTALHAGLNPWLSDQDSRIALAYCLAWLQVASGNSVLPPWVRRRFPVVPEILAALRDRPCKDDTCSYCTTTHNPRGQLQRYFGFENFRPQPFDSEGESLQESLVRHAISDHSLLGILPTGGGKSLCYQLPALVRYQRRGLLTIVISPLQALMKDQVDNLRNRTGFPGIAALCGLLTSPERGQVLRDVALGDIAILYVSPEQLRGKSFKNTIQQREIGCWVFDEAHCLSKWGHDFRPDYLYAARFIKEFAEENKMPIPPIQCFTATAKADVKQEIIAFFGSEPGVRLKLFESGVERDNLRFAVTHISKHEKIEHINELLHQYLTNEPKGCAIIYCATRKTTQYVAEALTEAGWQAGAFHGGMEAPEKQHILDNFLNGLIDVICATNAFGMGIDKENVRLVVHYDIPGSLENYLQEAGRAGRDRQEADCILLYDENDIEKQFQLNALSEVKQYDIKQILRSLRMARCNKDGEIILTPGELLSSEQADISFDPDDPMAATKVITAISWLERADFLVRNENRTSCFQGRPMVADLNEAQQKIRQLNLSKRQQERWLIILEALM